MLPHHRLDGPPAAAPLLLAPSLGTTLALWEPQLEALRARFRLVRIDHRGHGGSPIPGGAWSIEAMAADVRELLDALGIERAALCGISLGGAVCLQVALDAPDRVSGLVLACTAARFAAAEAYLERARVVREQGLDAVADAVLARWFTPGLARRRPELAARFGAMLRATPAEGYARCCEAIAAFDARSRLAAVQAPATVIAGADDPATPPPFGEELAEGIAGARLVVLADAAHLANVEQPDAFTAAVLAALAAEEAP